MIRGLALLLAALALAAQRQKSTFGALVIGNDADSAALTKQLKDKFPWRLAPGDDQRATQHAIDDLILKEGVKKIVVVPLTLSSHSAELDQLRFLLGIRKEPTSAALKDARLVDGKIPRLDFKKAKKMEVVLTRALDDGPEAAALLEARVKDLTKEPQNAILLAVADALPGDAENSQWTGTLASLVDSVKRRLSLRQAELIVLRENETTAPSSEESRKTKERLSPRDRARQDLVKRVRELKKEQGAHVLVLPLSLSRGGAAAELPKLLDGLMVKSDGRTLLYAEPGKKESPTVALAQWIERTAASASKLPDMRTFKDGYKPLKSDPLKQHKRLGGNTDVRHDQSPR
jgi:hypothetical protein